MATTINSYSDALETFVVDKGDRMEPAAGGQKVRAAFFTVTLASQAAGEDIAVAIIPENATIIGGVVTVSATLSNSATLSVGLMAKDGSGYVDDALTDTDDVAQFKALAVVTDTTAAYPAANAIAATHALGFGYVTEKECYLTLSTSAGTVGTEVVKGYVLYLIP